MKRKLKSKAPLSRRKAQDQGPGDDSELNARVENDGVKATKTVVSPKSKCYNKKRHVGRKTHSTAASSSNDDQSQTSAFDYNSDEDISVKDRETPLGVKRKRGPSKDEESTSLGTSRYKKSQQALNLINKSGEKEKKNGKKRKGRKAKSSNSSDEEDFNQPVKKSIRFLVPDIELVKFTSTTTQGKSKKALLNLRKNKRNVGTDDQHSEESNRDISGDESGTADQKNNSKSADSLDDGDDEREEDDDDDKKDGIHSPEHHNKRVTRLDNESEQTSKENTVKSTSEIKCPVCSKVFDELIERSKINEHVNSCLDSEGASKNKTEIPENDPKSSLSILQDQLIAFEYQRKEVQETGQGSVDAFGGEDGLYFCQICHKDLSKMNSQRRQQHINKCCDQMEKATEEKNVQDARKNDVKKNTISCPLCNQEFKSKKSWQPHLKKCAQENNVPAHQLLEIVKQQDQHQREMESTSHQTEERTEARPNEDGKKKTGQARKKRKVGKDLRDVDEETRLAMALSASMAPPPPPGNDGRKPKRKRKKDNEVIPALLLRSKEETQNVIAARAAQVVCNRDDDSDEDSISCTPALAPSSLAEQFLKVEQVNAKIVKEVKSNDQVTEETKSALAENSNQDKEDLAVEGDSSCTPGTSSKPMSGDTTVVLLSDMLASPDMCRSFLSFLDVADEEATTETNEESNEQPAASVTAGRSAPLWSMASLDDTESSINEFYVPGLLPVTSPKQPKKTSRKSSSTNQRKVSVRPETQEGLAKNTAKRSEDICEDNEEGTSDKPNKTMSESELTPASQAANLNILLELAGDGDDDRDGSQESPRKSSVDPDDDDDDDEVFPSSGFCLPVGPNNQTNKGDHNVPSSLSVFVQDMSKMVGNKMLSDVMMVTKGNENIPAHSFMLASRSQVLANMISEAHVVADGQQSTDKPIHLSFSDVETDAVRCVLQYIYTASVNVPQSCIDDTIGLADRLELFELVKACQDSRTIHEEQQEKNGSEDPEEDVIRCSLSAEELLNAIWQDETGNVEAKENNQEESEEEWNEGFDDDDIEEVRIFQTQAVRKRTCSEDTLQEPLEGILNLDDKNEEMKTDNMGRLNRTTTEPVNSDDMVLVMEVDDGINGRRQSQQNEESKERTVPKATEVIHLKTAVLGSCLEEKENENWGAKKLGDEKDNIVHSYSKDGRDDKRRDSTYDDQERDFGKLVTYDDQERDFGKRDFGKRDTNDDQERDIESDECDKLNEKEQSPTSDIQMTGIMSYDDDDDNDKHGDDDDDVEDGNIDVVDDDDQSQGSGNNNNMDHESVSGKVDLTEDDDDGQDDDDENHGPDHDNNMNAHSMKGKVDLTEDEDDEQDDDDENHGPDHDNNMNAHSMKGKVDLTEDEDDEKDDDDENHGPDHDNNMNAHSMKGKVDLTEDEDDEKDDDENHGPDHDNDMNAHILKDKVDLTEDEDDEHNGEDDDDGREAARVTKQNSRLKGDHCKSIDDESDENDKYRSVEEESGEEYRGGDITILNQSISLLSDDNDWESPEKVPDNDLVIPETPHAKKRQKSPEDHQSHDQSSQSIDQPSNTSVSYSPRPEDVSCNLSNEDEPDDMYADENEKDRVNEDDNDNEKDHVSEDEEAFLEKLKSRIDAKNKNAGKERKKRKGKEKPSKNRSKNKKGTTETPMELGSSSISNHSRTPCSSRMAKSSIDTRVVDLSMDNEFVDLMYENEEVDLEGNASGRENSGSNKDEEESCTSLSPPRMLSPRVPSPCYSDFDHDVSSPAVSPVHSDVAVVESTSYADVNHSPDATPPVRRLSTELQDERSPKDLQAEEDTREKRVSRVNIQQEAIDSDQESEISDDVALLPVPTADNGGKTDDEEEKRNEIQVDRDNNRTCSKTSTGAVSAINTKTSLFKRLGAAKYGLASTETETSSDVESDVSGLNVTSRERPGNSQTKSQKSTSPPPVPDQNDFYDDGGFNCDVDDFEACLDGDDSFMAHAAEQIELIEKQAKPVIQEKPEYQVPLGKPRTPAQVQRSATRTPRNNKAQDASVDSPITPMPDYDNMTTPDLKGEVNKFGVRALPKKKMKAKLIEIYQYTHPGAAEQTQPNDNTKEKPSKNTKGPSLKQAKAPPRTAKPASKTFVSSSQPTRQPAKKKKIPASQIRESSDSDDDGCSSGRSSSQRPASFKPSSHSTNKDSQGIFPCNIEDGSSSSSYSTQPAPSLRRLKDDRIESAISLSDEDKGPGRGSNESNNEDEDEFGEVSILIDKETDTESQQVNSDNLENKLLSFIENNPDIYLKVLSYQPIDLMALHELIKSSGIKCRLGQLVDFLDTQCITFTTAGQKPRQRRKPARKKK